MRLTATTLLIALAVPWTAAWALKDPTPGKVDPRMQTAAYNPQEIYALHLMVGRTMPVIVDPAERIVRSWGSDAAHLRVDLPGTNVAALKAVYPMKPETFFLMTQADDGKDRIYAFQLDAIPLNPDDKDITYSVTFTNPVKQAEVRHAAYVRWRAKQDEKRDVADLENAKAQCGDFRYVLQGKTSADWDLLPTREVCSDGQNTYFHFPGNMVVPQIYAGIPDESKAEGVADYTFNSVTRIATVHRLARVWHLRSGDSMLCVFNKAYDPVGEQNTTGTRSPNILREVKLTE